MGKRERKGGRPGTTLKTVRKGGGSDKEKKGR